MIGAIAGDIIGSVYEFYNIKYKAFPLFWSDSCFTDDTVVTCCVAEALMRSWAKDRFETLEAVTADTMHEIGKRYPACGYGGRFYQWMFGPDPKPYYSCGNGAAMRISPVIDIARDVEEAKELARRVTCITHNHPEGMKGAEVVAVAGVMAKSGKSKADIRDYVEGGEYYDLGMSVKDWRKATLGHGKEICQVAVPQALTCFLEGRNYEDVIRNCISTGGDSDTVAAIAGGIAEAYYGVPRKIQRTAREYLDDELCDILNRFEVFKLEGGAVWAVGAVKTAI